MIFLPFQVFLDDDKTYLNADFGWYKYNYFYYGIGENKVEQERYDVTFPNFELLEKGVIGVDSQAIYNNNDGIDYFTKRDF